MEIHKASYTGRSKRPRRITILTVIILTGAICGRPIAVKTDWHMMNDLFIREA